MHFEDIVDMDWIDSNTTSDEPLPTSSPSSIKPEPMDMAPSAFPGLDADSLYRFAEQPFLWQQDLAYPAASAPCSSSSPVSPTSLPDKDDPMSKDDLIMPSTEHIKQLIEIAKRHLALREQGLRPEDIQGAAAAAAAAAAMPLFAAAAAAAAAPPTAVTVMPDTVAPESLKLSSADAAKPRASDTQEAADKKPSSRAPTPPPHSSARRASSVSLGDETMTLEAYAESDGIDIKKLTPKERRQLRNKISARNFRVRRKEYINTLEAQVDEHKQHADRLQSRLNDAEEENKQLRQEVDTLRRQNQLLLQKSSSSSSSASAAASSELVRTPSSPRVASPIPKPNLNKDISMLGSKASETYRQDTRILVSSAVMPVWDFDRIVAARHPAPPAAADVMPMAAGYVLAGLVQLAADGGSLPTCHSTQPQRQHTIDTARPLLPDERDFGSDKAAAADHMEYLYDTLIMSALESNAANKAFRWWNSSSSSSSSSNDL